jgi:hypothetical protein
MLIFEITAPTAARKVETATYLLLPSKISSWRAQTSCEPHECGLVLESPVWSVRP